MDNRPFGRGAIGVPFGHVDVERAHVGRRQKVWRGGAGGGGRIGQSGNGRYDVGVAVVATRRTEVTTVGYLGDWPFNVLHVARWGAEGGPTVQADVLTPWWRHNSLKYAKGNAKIKCSHSSCGHERNSLLLVKRTSLYARVALAYLVTRMTSLIY